MYDAMTAQKGSTLRCQTGARNLVHKPARKQTLNASPIVSYRNLPNCGMAVKKNGQLNVSPLQPSLVIGKVQMVQGPQVTAMTAMASSIRARKMRRTSPKR